MRRETGACPVCGRVGEQEWIRSWDGGFDLWRCQVCGVGHASPFVAADEAWYAQFEIYRAAFDERFPLEWRHRKFFEVTPPPRAGAALLDVGCGTGTFLKAARERGWDVVGLDFEPKRAEFGRRELGVPIEVTTLTEHLGQGHAGRYDVVTCFEIVEHVHDPRGFVAKVRRALAPGGRVAVSMPNWSRRFQLAEQIGDYPPHHLTWWTPESLRRFLEGNGFTDVRVYEEPFDLRRVLFLRIRTGLGQLAGATAARVAGDRARAQVMAARLTRMTKEALLSTARPVGAVLARMLGWKGIGLLALGSKMNGSAQ